MGNSESDSLVTAVIFVNWPMTPLQAYYHSVVIGEDASPLTTPVRGYSFCLLVCLFNEVCVFVNVQPLLPHALLQQQQQQTLINKKSKRWRSQS